MCIWVAAFSVMLVSLVISGRCSPILILHSPTALASMLRKSVPRPTAVAGLASPSVAASP